MFSSLADGLRSAARQPKLVALIWAAYLLLSLVPALPGLWWLRAGLDFSPASSAALRRFDFGLLYDLGSYNHSSVFQLLTMTLLAAGLVASVASAFVMGGMLKVLGGADDRRPFMHLFARGGGYFFWRFVRLAATAGACGVLAAAAVAAAAGQMTKSLSESEWEPGGYLAGLVIVASVAAAAALCLLALDYARIRVARDDSRRMLRAYFGAMGFVLRHLVGAYGMALVTIATLAGVMLLYVAWETNSPVASSSALIAILFVFQQLAVGARVFLRVALIGAERAFFNRMSPAPAVVIAPPAARAASAPPAPRDVAPPFALDEFSVEVPPDPKTPTA
jgi:hypothetical protein